MQIIAYKSIDGKIFECEEEMLLHNEEVSLNKIIHSIDGWLENDYPDNAGVVKEILISLRDLYGSITKKKLQELIDKVNLKVKD